MPTEIRRASTRSFLVSFADELDGRARFSRASATGFGLAGTALVLATGHASFELGIHYELLGLLLLAVGGWLLLRAHGYRRRGAIVRLLAMAPQEAGALQITASARAALVPSRELRQAARWLVDGCSFGAMDEKDRSFSPPSVDHGIVSPVG